MPLNEDIEKVEALRTKLLGIMDEATVDGTIDYSLVKSIEGGREAVVSEVNNLWKEVDELQASVEQQEEQLDHRAKMADLDRWLEQPQRDKTTTGHARTGEAQKSLGELFCTNENYDIDFKRGRGAIYAEHSINDMKALFNSVTGSTGFEPRAPRTGEVVPIVHRPVQLLDILTQVGTTEPAIIYMEQTTRTAPTDMGIAEGAAYSQATLDFTERTRLVRQRGVYIPVTQIQLEDVPAVRQLIDMDLVGMLMEDVDNQCINGNDSDQNFLGFLHATGRGNIARSGDEAVMTAIHRAWTNVRVTGRSMPTHILLNSEDWSDIVTTQNANGMYAIASATEQAMQRLWGLPVVLVDSLAQGTGVVFDNRWVTLRDRRDVVVRMADRWAVEGTNTAPTGQYNIWCDIRACLVIRRPAAICEVTNL